MVESERPAELKVGALQLAVKLRPELFAPLPMVCSMLRSSRGLAALVRNELQGKLTLTAASQTQPKPPVSWLQQHIALIGTLHLEGWGGEEYAAPSHPLPQLPMLRQLSLDMCSLEVLQEALARADPAHLTSLQWETSPGHVGNSPDTLWAGVTHFSQLQHLHLDVREIHETDYVEYDLHISSLAAAAQQLPRLAHLHLTLPRGTSAVMASLSQLTRLTRLQLRLAPQDDEGWQQRWGTVSSLQQLRELGLELGDMATCSAEHIAPLAQLPQLLLHVDGIDGTALNALPTQLQELQLWSHIWGYCREYDDVIGRVEGSAALQLSEMTQLIALTLCMPLEAADVLPGSVQQLYVAGYRGTLGTLLGLTALTQLHLHWCQAAAAELVALSSLSRLSSLTLDYITDQGNALEPWECALEHAQHAFGKLPMLRSLEYGLLPESLAAYLLQHASNIRGLTSLCMALEVISEHAGMMWDEDVCEWRVDGAPPLEEVVPQLTQLTGLPEFSVRSISERDDDWDLELRQRIKQPLAAALAQMPGVRFSWGEDGYPWD